MFDKNPFFSKTKNVKIGFGACFPNTSLSKTKKQCLEKHCQPNRALTFDMILTRPSWPETFGSTINQTKVYWFDLKNKPKSKPESKTKSKFKKHRNSKSFYQNPEKRRTFNMNSPT